jgi:DNA gyrase/topoisomerase IV subunit A
MAGDHPTYPESSTEDDLRMARQQVHIHDAIVTAANDAHAVLDILLDAADPDAARQALRERYGFSDVQASAVLDVQLARVTASQRQRIEQHLHEATARVTALERELGEA